MSKPDDIPQDVWDAAVRAAASIYDDAFLWDHDSDGFYLDSAVTRNIVARAILAERERCAKLLEEGFDRVVGEPYGDGGRSSKNDLCPHKRYMYEDCEQCAADAIRRGPPVSIEHRGEVR